MVSPERQIYTPGHVDVTNVPLTDNMKTRTLFGNTFLRVPPSLTFNVGLLTPVSFLGTSEVPVTDSRPSKPVNRRHGRSQPSFCLRLSWVEVQDGKLTTGVGTKLDLGWLTVTTVPLYVLLYTKFLVFKRKVSLFLFLFFSFYYC